MVVGGMGLDDGDDGMGGPFGWSDCGGVVTGFGGFGSSSSSVIMRSMVSGAADWVVTVGSAGLSRLSNEKSVLLLSQTESVKLKLLLKS